MTTKQDVYHADAKQALYLYDSKDKYNIVWTLS